MFHVGLDEFREASKDWGSAEFFLTQDSSTADASIVIERPGEPPFQIRHFTSGQLISTDGTPEQSAEVAVWAANAFPPNEGGEVWLTDQAYTGHVVLRPGMTVEDIRRDWMDH